ncbi:MAG: hypothetical protein B6245_14770 [Desulfobacteraceae bacterium 4572_88]|nr:MAG: hypothetical protein B6245_14770 [Desulfobacteraceae bacterium 4572_88]
MTAQEYNEETFLPLKRALQTFQQSRISGTYADLKANPEYAQIGTFFFEKLYAPEDFSFRDASIKKLHKISKGAVYKGMISAVSMVIELHELSDDLDNLMVEKMIENSVDTDMDMDQYQDIYRQLDNYDQRIYQIHLSARVIHAFHRLSKMWVVGISLNTVRTAAHLLGMGKIMDFVHEGYVAFRTIDNIRYFMETIEEREMAWHDEIWFAGKAAGNQVGG